MVAGAAAGAAASAMPPPALPLSTGCQCCGGQPQQQQLWAPSSSGFMHGSAGATLGATSGAGQAGGTGGGTAGEEGEGWGEGGGAARLGWSGLRHPRARHRPFVRPAR